MRYLFAIVLATATLATAQIPNPYEIFDKDAVHEIRITFPNEDWYEVLTANYSGVRAENPYFPASIEWGSNKFETIGVRFKGNSSYSAANTKKKPFRLKLNEFVKGQKIDGIGSFSLSNGWNDPSFVREKLYYELAASLGLKAPRSNFAALYINGEYWGLYILTEVINSDFLKNYLGKGEDEGNLYKANVGASFGYLGEDKNAYTSTWEKQSNEEIDDWTDLIALTKLIGETPATELKDKLESVMDIDSVLTALALDNATVNLDSYVGMGQNFNIYLRPSDKKWLWIPWDPSLAFGALSQGQTIQSMQQLALEYVTTGGFGGGGGPGGGGPAGPGGATQAGRPLATKLWAIPEYKERYRQIYQRLVDNVFVPDTILARMNELRDMIRPWIEKDTQKLVTTAQFEGAMTTDSTMSGGPGGGGPGGPGGAGGGRGGGIPGLNEFVTQRAAFLKSQFEASPATQFVLQADASPITLTQTAGGTAPTQSVSLAINGTATSANYTLYATTDSGGSWLTLSPAGGTIPGSFKVSVGSKLDPGTYSATIKIYSPGATNSAILIPVSLTVN